MQKFETRNYFEVGNSRFVGQEEQREMIGKINDGDSAKEFLIKNYWYAINKSYISDLVSQTKNFPHRDDNPSYWKLVGTMARESARYGYTEPSGQIIRVDRNKWLGKPVLDVNHPLYMLGSLSYVADNNTKSYDNKFFATEYWDEKEGPNTLRDKVIWCLHNRRAISELLNGAYIDHYMRYLSIDRVLHNLPVFYPDSSFHTRISKSGLVADEIEEMTNGKNNQKLVDSFGPVLEEEGIDLASVLLDPREKWLKH